MNVEESPEKKIISDPVYPIIVLFLYGKVRISSNFMAFSFLKFCNFLVLTIFNDATSITLTIVDPLIPLHIIPELFNFTPSNSEYILLMSKYRIQDITSQQGASKNYALT